MSYYGRAERPVGASQVAASLTPTALCSCFIIKLSLLIIHTTSYLSGIAYHCLTAHIILCSAIVSDQSYNCVIMDADKIPDFLADQRDQAPSESQALFLDFEDYWERKLWHQLTNSLVEFFRTPASAPQRLPIFKSFILSFADRINQLNFVSLGLLASTQCGGSSPLPFVCR